MGIGDPPDYSFVWLALVLAVALWLVYSRSKQTPAASEGVGRERLAEVRARQQAAVRAQEETAEEQKAPGPVTAQPQDPPKPEQKPSEPPPKPRDPPKFVKPSYQPTVRERFSDLKSCTRSGG